MTNSIIDKEKLKSKAFGAAIWKVSERLGYAVVSIVIQVVLARLLDPEAFGVIAVVVVFVNVATVFVQSGMNTSLVQSKTVDEVDASTVFWFSFAMAGMLYFALFVCAPSIEKFYSMEGLASILRVIGLVLFPGAYNSIQVSLLQRDLRMREQLVATLIAGVVSGAVGVFFALFGAGVWSLVAQTMVQRIAMCVAMAFQVRWKPSLIFSLSCLKLHFNFGWKLLAASLLHTLYTSLYDLVVGKAFSAAALGYFSQGKKYPASAESILDSAIGSVTLPTAVKLRDSLDDMKNLMRRALQVSISLITPFMLALCVAARPIVIVVLGEKWAPSIPIFMVFCVSASITPVTRINLQCFNAAGRSDVFLGLEVKKKIIAIVMVFVASLFGDLLLLAYTSLAYSVIAVLLNMSPSKKLFGYSMGSQIKDVGFPYLQSVVAALFGLVPQVLVSSELVLLFLQPLVVAAAYVVIGEAFGGEAYSYSKALVMKAVRNLFSRAVGRGA